MVHDENINLEILSGYQHKWSQELFLIKKKLHLNRTVKW